MDDAEVTRDEIMRAQRRRAIEEGVVAELRRVRGHAPRMRSMIVGVSQYWNDAAHDEIHLNLVGSELGAAEWPHVCVEPDDAYCWACAAIDTGRRDAALSARWALEAFCPEGANQDQRFEEAYRPLAFARLDGAGRVDLHVLAALVRPWLDLPRERAPAAPRLDAATRRLLEATGRDRAAVPVLADALGERGDPRGELVALARAGAPAASALEGTWGRSWLGALEPWVPRAGVRLEDGLPRDVEVYVEAEQAGALARLDVDDDAWAVIERLRFAPGSQAIVAPAFRRLRALGTLDVAAMRQLLACGERFATEHLAVRPDALELVCATDRLPALRRLRLVGSALELGAALGDVRLPRLDGLELVVDAGGLAATVEVARRRGLPTPVRVCELDEDTGRATGIAIELRGDEARVERIGLARGATPSSMREAITALPRALRVELVAGPLWEPSPAERAAVER